MSASQAIRTPQNAARKQRVPPAQPIAAGEPVLRVPLRLAVTDAAAGPAEGAAFEALPGGGWQDRIVSKLLRIVEAGEASPWSAYVQARLDARV
jgi:hypothetical protein